MIDMHSHCLPGIDDGAKDVSVSIKMLEDSFSQGVTMCAATPHCIIHEQKDLEKFLENRDKSFQELKGAIEKNSGQLPQVILGGEIYLDNDLNEYEGIDRLCYTGTNYLLLEFPMDRANPKWAEWIYELNRKGLKVLVAHVDRYPEWEKMMSDFKGLEVKYQVNASRFIKFSDRKLLRNLLDYGHRYIISSDMHNVKSRPSNMLEGYKKAEKKLGKAIADDFFGKNAERILFK